MKKSMLAMCVCGLCFAIITGCKNKEADNSSVDIVEAVDPAKPDENSEEVKTSSGTEDEKFTDLTNEEVPEEEIDSDKYTDELCGDVKSINAAEKFVIVSKVYIEESEEATMAYAPAEGSGDEEIITVYFTGEAKYILETGRADGTNTTRTEAEFSDISEKDVLNLKGKENITGTEFLAAEVEIIRVID